MGKITVEFSGGLELLFANKRSFTLPLPLPKPSTSTTASSSSSSSSSSNSLSAEDRAARDAAGENTVGRLVHHLVDEVMVDKRKELFVVDGSVRPGILVLINEADWELEGEESYELQDGDTVLFVSTLHGG